jgi:hypothetical protein
MFRRLLPAMLILLAGAQSSWAYLNSPLTVHNTEIALIYVGLKRTTIPSEDAATVRRLEAKARRLYDGGQVERARAMQREALLKLGYRYEKFAVDAKSAPTPAASQTNLTETKSTRGCGDVEGHWLAPKSGT